MIAASIPITAITISSSTIVKPCLFCLRFIVVLVWQSLSGVTGLKSVHINRNATGSLTPSWVRF